MNDIIMENIDKKTKNEVELFIKTHIENSLSLNEKLDGWKLIEKMRNELENSTRGFFDEIDILIEKSKNKIAYDFDLLDNELKKICLKYQLNKEIRNLYDKLESMLMK